MYQIKFFKDFLVINSSLFEDCLPHLFLQRIKNTFYDYHLIMFEYSFELVYDLFKHQIQFLSRNYFLLSASLFFIRNYLNYQMFKFSYRYLKVNGT
jgi:hypothetical protein